MGKRDVRLVVNRVNPKLYRSMGLTVDDVMDLVGYPLLGLVPEDRNVTWLRSMTARSCSTPGGVPRQTPSAGCPSVSRAFPSPWLP